MTRRETDNLPVEGLDDLLDRLVAAGGTEVRPVVTVGSNRNAMLEDPEGNCFDLTEVDPS
jgi:predicted enzyme related to lactoylglutathione lyase